MPLYVYTCRTCELETEELHPLGQAPARGIRCPICGGYFERDVALVNIGGKTQAQTIGPDWASASAHPADCPCCVPRRAKPTTQVGHRRPVARE
jgi:putative FmdB family regulatory protein